MNSKTTDSERANPSPTSALLAIRGGKTIVLADKATDRPGETTSGGTIYTDEMPALEDLLRRGMVTIDDQNYWRKKPVG